MTDNKNTSILAALVKLPNLNSAERQLIREIATHKNITKLQQEQLLYLQQKYFGGQPE